MDKKCLGYISSSPFWHNTFLPQRVQNIIVRDFCLTYGFSLVWSSPEVSYGSNLYTFDVLTDQIRDCHLHGIVFCSHLQIPYIRLVSLIERCLNADCSIYFAIENIHISSVDDLRMYQDTILASSVSVNWNTTFRI